MTRLLVSVRDADEARLALAAGAALIDVKEPFRGALGAADAGQIAAVVRAVDGRVPVSAAMGELFAEPRTNRLDPRIQFAKFGLAGATKHPRWREIWAEVIGELPVGVQSVAVAYADWRTCDAPAPGEVIDLGVTLGCEAVLIDTYDKTRGGLLDYCSLNDLERLLAAAREHNLLTVLGGSLDANTIRTIAPLQPDFAAVRTAVCETHRAGRMDKTRVKRLVELLVELDARTRLKSDEKFLDRPCELR